MVWVCLFAVVLWYGSVCLQWYYGMGLSVCSGIMVWVLSVCSGIMVWVCLFTVVLWYGSVCLQWYYGMGLSVETIVSVQ